LSTRPAVAPEPVADLPGREPAERAADETPADAPSPASTAGAPPPLVEPDEPVTPAGLPRRTPHPTATRESTLAAAPPPRPPDAVFELVARYEAGRRRAGTRPTDAPEDAE